MAHELSDQALELEGFREYLGLLARLQIDSRLRGKVDLSGVVQQTLWEAFQALPALPSQDLDRKAAWLRQILANNLRDEVRKLGTAARNVKREQSLEAALDESLSGVEAWLAAEHSSPSQHAMRNEQMLHLAKSLGLLPDDQRLAIELHHLQGIPLAEVARQLNRSKGAVAALLFRGLKKLREFLQNQK
jgi:RNA polymerase sigma-70 factor (ECF subfamily)